MAKQLKVLIPLLTNAGIALVLVTKKELRTVE